MAVDIETDALQEGDTVYYTEEEDMFSMILGGGGMPGAGGAAMPNGGGAPGGTGGMMTPEPAFQPYSLEKLTVASVTSQEHMTVSVTVDELEISGIYIGQAAVVSVDALGGEQFDAAVTKISNSGTNEGGNSKFTVELTLARSGDMLPGMYASAVITLQEHDRVLSIPVAALNKDGRNVIVYTGYNEEDRTLENPVAVTTGVADGENVQILTGLSEGQTVYYSYYDTYTGSEEPESAGRSMGMLEEDAEGISSPLFFRKRILKVVFFRFL